MITLYELEKFSRLHFCRCRSFVTFSLYINKIPDSRFLKGEHYIRKVLTKPIILTCAVDASSHKAGPDSSIFVFVLQDSRSAVACTKWLRICGTNLVSLICRACGCIGLETIITMPILSVCRKMKQFGKVFLNSPFTIILYYLGSFFIV